MKNLIILISVFVSNIVCAQITEIDSVNNIESTVYVGTLGGPKIGVDGKSSGFITTRIGGTITWTPSKNLSFFGLGAGEADQTGTVSPFALFGTTISHKKVKVTFGKIASPMTELRPIPTTGPGQFEPWTRAQILGSSLGGKISVNFKNISFIGGNFVRGNEYSHEIGIKTKHIQASGYRMNASGIFGGAINTNFKNISTTFMFNDSKNIGMLNIITLPYTRNLFVYSDIGFDTAKDKMIRGEWGIFKTYKAKNTKGILGLGYSDEVQSFKGYIFLYL